MMIEAMYYPTSLMTEPETRNKTLPIQNNPKLVKKHFWVEKQYFASTCQNLEYDTKAEW